MIVVGFVEAMLLIFSGHGHRFIYASMGPLPEGPSADDSDPLSYRVKGRRDEEAVDCYGPVWMGCDRVQQ